MDVRNEFSGEVLQKILTDLNKYSKSIYEQNEKAIDLLHLLLMSAQDVEDKHKWISEKLVSMDSKLDSMLDMLTSLEGDFSDLKTERRELEQKITLMVSKLKRIEDRIPDEDTEDYRILAESLYTNWDSLDPLTKRFIPLAEYLYSKLQKYEKADYSPVILELCRAIENEFLLKVFRRYTLDLIHREGKHLDSFLAPDRLNRELTRKTGQFIKAINKARKTGKPEYTLGQMNTILSMLKQDETVAASPLLQDFKQYLIANTEASKLLDADYIRKINDIVNRFRNPSAHPDFMSIHKADECREVMPERLDYLMDCVS